MEPGQRAFDDPPRATEPTAMGRAALGELGVDPAAMQRVAMRLRIVAPVALNQPRFADRTTGTPTQRRDGADQTEQGAGVVAVDAGESRCSPTYRRHGGNAVMPDRPTATPSGLWRLMCTRSEPESA